MAQVIARRYRPQTFDEVIGQEAIVRTLRNAVASGRIAHGFIFSGHRGIGKTTVARILAKALNCRAAAGPTPTPCGECESCREIRDGNAVDVIEINAASNRGIDEIRALRERVRYRPARDRYKFFILDEAHQLTTDAFNALLKTLEEPPEWAVFVLATTEPDALPATIRSRCQHFAFRAVPYGVLAADLARICRVEGVPAEEEALGLIAEAGEGSVRDAQSLLDQAITHAAAAAPEEAPGIRAEAVRTLLGRVSSAQIRDLLAAVAQDSARDTLARAGALLEAGIGPAPLCWQLTRAVRNALIAQSAPALLEATESERAAAAEAAAWFREEELTRFLQILLRCAGDLRYGQQERLHFELALLKMLHARRLSSLEDVLAALGPGEPAAPARPASAAVATAPAATATAPRPAAPAATPTTTPARPAPSAPAPEPARAPTSETVSTPAPGANGDTQTVLSFLAGQNKASLLSILGKAEWRWPEGGLELAFAAADAALAKLADSAATRKALSEACRAALGRTVEIRVTSAAGAVAASGEAAAAPGGEESGASLEERARQHPLLRELRERIPTHVLRTRPLES